ncbi:MAG: T9SS type A sorting domain-containing protein [Bacteroidota bacterium]|nr:T9SS type A sorting domain-containing protein [Bacteroidota bacterium]
MKKIYLSGILLILALGLIFILKPNNTSNNSRKKYESWLVRVLKGSQLEKQSIREKKGADEPDMAAFQNYFMTVDPALQRVPHERLAAAYRETMNLQRLKSSRSGLQWTNIPADMGGRTRAIMFDPNDPSHDKVWAGGITGGLWVNYHISDPLSYWYPVGDLWNCLAIRCIAYDPHNPQILYVGTGEPETAVEQYRESSGLGDGIWKSADGGQTWSQLPSTSGFDYITKIVVRAEGRNSVIYAGVVSGIYHGTHLSNPSDGLFRSADGGNTWTQVLPDINGLLGPYSPSDVTLSGDSTRIIVGTMPNIVGDGAAVFLYSDLGTPGSWTVDETWRNDILNSSQNNIPGRIVLGSALSDPNVVYALVASGHVNPDNNFMIYNCYRILRSSNKGETWVRKSLPSDNNGNANFATIAWHALDIAVDPNDANSLFIGGLDVQKTTDGGNSWTRVSDWALMYYGGGPQYIHADQHAIVYMPGSSSNLLFGSDGGIFYTQNGTAYNPAFEERNLGYNTLQFYSAAIHPTYGVSNYLGGLQDNGSLIYYGSSPLTESSMVSGGDGAYAFFDNDEPGTFISSVYYNHYYIFKNGYYYNDLDAYSGTGIFVNPADYDYVNNRIYANGVDFISSTPDVYLQIDDVTEYWALGSLKNANTGSSVYFSAVRWSPNSSPNNATLFLGTVSGHLFKLVHAESTPVTTEITGPAFPPGCISSIAIGPTDSTLLVTFSNYGVVSVWLTHDGGATWKNVEGNLPDMPVRWAIFHPRNYHYALLATESGIWSTGSLDEPTVIWTPDNSGLANVRVDMLAMRESDNQVLAATHGRGFYTTTWDVADAVPFLTKSTFKLYPNPTSGPVTVRFDNNHYRNFKVRIYNPEGKLVSERENSVSGVSDSSFDLSGLSEGVYVVSLLMDGKEIMAERIIKNQ